MLSNSGQEMQLLEVKIHITYFGAYKLHRINYGNNKTRHESI